MKLLQERSHQWTPLSLADYNITNAATVTISCNTHTALPPPTRLCSGGESAGEAGEAGAGTAAAPMEISEMSEISEEIEEGEEGEGSEESRACPHRPHGCHHNRPTAHSGYADQASVTAW